MSDERELPPMLPALLDAFRTSNVAVQIMTERGGVYRYRYVNRASAAVLGYTPEELVTRDPLQIVIPEERHRMVLLADEFRSGRPMPPAMEITLIHKDGRRVRAECTNGRVDMGDEQAFAIVFHEMGTQTQLSLLEADRIALVGALAAGFAHEINNPLTSMLLNLRSLRKLLTSLPEAQHRAALRGLDDVTTGAERIASNVRALQTLATHTGRQTIDLSAVVTSALRLVAPTVEPRARVERQIEPVCPVIGEESRVGQAVLAMLLFSSSGFEEEAAATNQLSVVVEERADLMVVEVSDNGRTLSDEEIASAFDPFFRSPARGAGVGVGLGVARSVATTLGGEVTLARRVGGGAVITMQLPPAHPVSPSFSPAPLS